MLDNNEKTVERLESLLSSMGRWLKIAHRKCIEEYSDLDLTEHQYRVLKALKDGGPYKMMELGVILHTSSGSLTVMIDRLVAKNMVRRFFMEEDRRVVMVDITKTGQEALEQFRTGMVELLTERINGYDIDKRHRITAAAQVLQEVFDVIR